MTKLTPQQERWANEAIEEMVRDGYLEKIIDPVEGPAFRRTGKPMPKPGFREEQQRIKKPGR